MSNSEICKMEITRIKRDSYLHTDRQKNIIGQGPWKWLLHFFQSYFYSMLNEPLHSKCTYAMPSFCFKTWCTCCTRHNFCYSSMQQKDVQNSMMRCCTSMKTSVNEHFTFLASQSWKTTETCLIWFKVPCGVNEQKIIFKLHHYSMFDMRHFWVTFKHRGYIEHAEYASFAIKLFFVCNQIRLVSSGKSTC